MSLNRYAKPKRAKPLNRMSLRKIIGVNNEVDVRIQLCERAGGEWTIKTRNIKLNNGTEIELRTVECHNGKCEECHTFNYHLEPHEDPPRSKGGKVSLEQSKMLCRRCHNKKKGQPMWSRRCYYATIRANRSTD